MNPKITDLLNQLALAIELDGLQLTLAIELDGLTVTATVPWHRDLGPEPAPGETAIDNLARAKQFAARGLRVDGNPGIVEPDLSLGLALCDFIAAPSTTPLQQEEKLDGSLGTTRDSAEYQVLTGRYRNSLAPGLGGRPALMYPGKQIEELIGPIQAPIGGNVA